MVDLGAQYRACKQSVIDARKAWCAAELTHAGKGRHACTDECIAPVRAGYEAVQFAKACVIAAGEQVKGQRFEDVAGRARPKGRV